LPKIDNSSKKVTSRNTKKYNKISIKITNKVFFNFIKIKKSCVIQGRLDKKIIKISVSAIITLKNEC